MNVENVSHPNNNFLRFSLPYFTSMITLDVSTYVSFSTIINVRNTNTQKKKQK